MMELDLVIKAVFAFLSGYFFWRLKKMESKVETSVNRKEVREMIEDQIKPYAVMQVKLEDRLERIEDKLDKLLEKK